MSGLSSQYNLHTFQHVDFGIVTRLFQYGANFYLIYSSSNQGQSEVMDFLVVIIVFIGYPESNI